MKKKGSYSFNKESVFDLLCFMVNPSSVLASSH
uniref:Uncharacterized protein n=1 Tax=Rhizophora mucronata TaxID=61149 RepID=A0A2P2R311_RHIMU